MLNAQISKKCAEFNFLRLAFVFSFPCLHLLQTYFMRFFSILLLMAISLPALTQTVNFNDHAKLWLVRHAEKEAGSDPLLTAEGNKRAGDLFRALKDKKIQRIYATQYKRTRNTGDSLRIYSGIEVVQYIADTTGEDLLKKIIEHNDLGTSILIIGHSNTIPKIIQKLGLPDYPRDYIPDAEFDNLFLLEYKKGKASLQKKKYGALSGASAAMQ